MYLVCLHNVISGDADEFDVKCSRNSLEEFQDFVEKASKTFHLIPFSEYLRRLKENDPDPRAVALTFDDGFMGVRQYAFPVLKRRGIDAGFFVNPPYLRAAKRGIFHFLEIEIAFRLTVKTSFLFEGAKLPLVTDEERVTAMKKFKKRLKAMPESERALHHETLLKDLDVSRFEIEQYAARDPKFFVMELGDVRTLVDAGWTVGPHSLSHRSLKWLSPAEVESEILGSKRELESLLGQPCEIFAYPYGGEDHVGDIAPRVCEKAGFRYSFTAIQGQNCEVADPQLLHRHDYKVFVKDFLAKS